MKATSCLPLLILSSFLLFLAAPCQSFAQEVQYQYAEVILPNGAVFQCQISDSLQKRSDGLKNHQELASGTGMLFIYPYPSSTTFWMPPEMKFSLDMIFLNHRRRVVHIAHEAFPCKDVKGLECESYSPKRAVSFVIEIPAGEAKRANLKKGNLIRIKYPKGYKFPED